MTAAFAQQTVARSGKGAPEAPKVAGSPTGGQRLLSFLMTDLWGRGMRDIGVDLLRESGISHACRQNH
jgi:hypothetical protein